MSALASNILFFIVLAAIMSAICISFSFWLSNKYEKYQTKHRKPIISKCKDCKYRKEDGFCEYQYETYVEREKTACWRGKPRKSKTSKN